MYSVQMKWKARMREEERAHPMSTGTWALLFPGALCYNKWLWLFNDKWRNMLAQVHQKEVLIQGDMEIMFAFLF